MVVVDDASVAKMRGGDVNVELYLDSRNTKGYGTATQILKPQSSNFVGERNVPKIVGLCRSGGGMRKNEAVDGEVAARGRMSGWKAGCPGAGCPGLTGQISGL